MAKIAGEVRISRPVRRCSTSPLTSGMSRDTTRIIRADKVSDGPVGKGAVFFRREVHWPDPRCGSS